MLLVVNVSVNTFRWSRNKLEHMTPFPIKASIMEFFFHIVLCSMYM